MTLGPNYTVIPNDWDSLTYIINDLSRIITETPQFADYLLKDGSRALTSNWNATHQITAANFVSTISNSPTNIPYSCTSQALNTNLNADLLDGHHATDFALSTLYDLSGTANQISLSGSGTGVLSTRNITLSLPQDIATTSAPQFARIGINAASNASYGIYMPFVVSSGGVNSGVYGGITSTLTSSGSIGTLSGLNFAVSYAPSGLLSANKISANTLQGVYVEISATSYPNETKNITISNVYGYRCPISLTRGIGASGLLSATNVYREYIIDATLTNGATIGTQYAFYCGVLSSGTTANWGIAINTRSYINANLSIGKDTTPAYPIDCVGDINSTGIYRISGVDKSTNWNAAYTHISNNGTDHSYINQSVTTSASPYFAKIGIGITPSYPLHLYNAAASNAYLEAVFNQENTAYSSRLTFMEGATQLGTFQMNGSTYGSGRSSTMEYANVCGGDITFITGTSPSVNSLKVRIKNDGTVGIGLSPAYQLDVFGDINTSTLFRVGGVAGINATVTYVDTLLGAKTLTFTKGILTAQV
jgi:hypothetical protein